MATIDTMSNMAGGNLPKLENCNRLALISYSRLHSARIKEFPAAWFAAYQQLEIEVNSKAEAAYYQRAWDQIHAVITVIAAQEAQRASKQNE
jgi:hypothetical protein